MGGLARKATALSQLREQGHTLLVVDGGDLFFTAPILDDAALEREKFRAVALVDGFNRFGTAAVTIGESDLTAGLVYLQELAAGAQFPFVSVNLRGAEGQPIFPGHVIVERGGLQVALVGASSQMEPGEGYHFSEPLEALEALLPELQGKTDLVVLLFHGSAADQLRIQNAGLPIDIILQSHLKGAARQLKGSAIPVTLLGQDGKQLSTLAVSISKPGSPLVDVTDIQRSITFVNRSLNRLWRNQSKDIPLEELYADNEQILLRITALRDRRDRAQRDLKGTVNRLQTGLMPLDSKYHDNLELLQVVDKALLAVEALNSAPASGL